MARVARTGRIVRLFKWAVENDGVESVMAIHYAGDFGAEVAGKQHCKRADSSRCAVDQDFALHRGGEGKVLAPGLGGDGPDEVLEAAVLSVEPLRAGVEASGAGLCSGYCAAGLCSGYCTAGRCTGAGLGGNGHGNSFGDGCGLDRACGDRQWC